MFGDWKISILSTITNWKYEYYDNSPLERGALACGVAGVC
ncbi:hypothetical protein FHS11_003492 [Mucilaginibacter gotjawali]|uniref:Uncharacterized protein n=1 Tax=Mucilaginibacter gotjawali TaxID=1550579 RepID=A0A839SIF7_9SPHI|nr:hypothetical protein [Mucilaginibacter gotjawali]